MLSNTLNNTQISEIKSNTIKHYDIITTSVNHFTRASFIGFTASSVENRGLGSFGIGFTAIGSFMIIGGVTDGIVSSFTYGKEICLALAGATLLYRIQKGDFYKASGQLAGFITAYYADDSFNKEFSLENAKQEKENLVEKSFTKKWEDNIYMGLIVSSTDLLVGTISSEDSIKSITNINREFSLGAANKFIDTFLFLETFKHIVQPKNLISLLICGSFPILLENRARIHDYAIGNNREHTSHLDKLFGVAYGLFFWLPVRKAVEYSVEKIHSIQKEISTNLKHASDCILTTKECYFFQSSENLNGQIENINEEEL